MTEPDVTLTDYALAVECAVLAALVWRWPAADARLRRWWVVLFASIGAGSLIGGTVHGFFLEPSRGNAILWRATLIALGVTTMALWNIGARVWLREPAVTWVSRAADVQLILYCATVLLLYSEFLIAIATYVPATIFAVTVMILTYRRTPHRLLVYGIGGMLLTFVAAAVQQLRIAVHPVYFNHNALFHAIQGLALFLIFLGAKWFVTAPVASRSPS